MHFIIYTTTANWICFALFEEQNLHFANQLSVFAFGNTGFAVAVVSCYIEKLSRDMSDSKFQDLLFSSDLKHRN